MRLYIRGLDILRESMRTQLGNYKLVSGNMGLRFVSSLIWILTLLSLVCVLTLLCQAANATDNRYLQILVASNGSALFLALLLSGNFSFSIARHRKHNAQVYWHWQIAELIAKASDARQPQRAGHAKAVAYYCVLISRQLGLSQSDCKQMELAGLLHDIGKIVVPDTVLQKQGKFTPDELQFVHSALIESSSWLNQVDGLQEVAIIVCHQNEHWNGKGVPGRLAGEGIPLGSRILAVALRFAAMTQARADRQPMSVVGGAFDALVAESGKALDPQVVRAFLAVMGRSL